MRFLVFTFACLGILRAYSQSPRSTLLSAVVVDADSLPVPDVAIINTRTFHTVRTNESGYFQTEIAEDDSVFIHHIAYKRRFANESDNGKIIVIEHQVNELKQVNITDNAKEELKNLQKTMKDIKRIAPTKKLTDFTVNSRHKLFVEQNGSHTRGFMPFFGPTTTIPLEQIISLVAGSEQKRQRKKLTPHYHLVKKKDSKKEK